MSGMNPSPFSRPSPFLVGQQVINAYCQKKSITDPATVRFLYDGTRINPNSTAADVSTYKRVCVCCVRRGLCAVCTAVA
jgi:Ubiquitin-2 like Rad60 SUMO-like